MIERACNSAERSFRVHHAGQTKLKNALSSSRDLFFNNDKEWNRIIVAFFVEDRDRALELFSIWMNRCVSERGRFKNAERRDSNMHNHKNNTLAHTHTHKVREKKIAHTHIYTHVEKCVTYC